MKDFEKDKTETFYATALLSDGKILFWRINKSKKSIYDFYKDFYYSGLDQEEYMETHKMEVKWMGFEYDDSDERSTDFNSLIFYKMAKLFFGQFEISEDIEGNKPYENKIKKQFSIATRYNRMDGSDYSVILDEDGKETDWELTDLSNKYGSNKVKIIIEG